MLLFCGLFANRATAQQIFTWNGSSDNNWANAANWTVTGSGSTSTYLSWSGFSNENRPSCN